MLERAVEEAARVSGIDPIRLRRRNLTKPSAMPYKTAVGTTIDSGEFEALLDKALVLADYDGFKQRRREAARRGKYRGLGVSCMLEHAGGFRWKQPRCTFRAARSSCSGSTAVDRPRPCHRV
jgi:carbon-monoxide dehydrogenase large subunit